MFPVFFQAIGCSVISAVLSLIRQIFCLIPLFFAFSRISLDCSWLAFPLSEIIAGGIGLVLFIKKAHEWGRQLSKI